MTTNVSAGKPGGDQMPPAQTDTLERDTLEAALKELLSTTASNEERWAKLAEHGATDRDLRAALTMSVGPNGRSGSKYGVCMLHAKPKLKFWYGSYGKGGAPAIVTASPRSTGKGSPASGGPDQCEAFVKALVEAPAYKNPAIELAGRVMRAELEGDTEMLDRAVRSGAVERAIEEGSREGRDLMKCLQKLGHCVPASSKSVPVGF